MAVAFAAEIGLRAKSDLHLRVATIRIPRWKNAASEYHSPAFGG